MNESKINNVQLEQKLNSEQMTKCVQSPPADAKPNVSGSGFRIVELDGVFKIERRFKKVKKSGCLWWSNKIEEYVWKDITTYGSECFRIPIYGTGIVVDTYKHKMPEFTNLEDAETALNKLINPTQPVYHYR
jgi:hypothetical protein